MFKVTSVEPQKKNPHRYNVYLDGKFAFGLDEDTIVKWRILVGKELSGQDLEEIYKDTELNKLIERVYGLLSRRARSEQEVRRFLQQLSYKRKIKGGEELSDLVIDALIQTLKLKGYINDLGFAEAWIASRSKNRGKIALKKELYQKGIEKGLIEKALSENLQNENQAALDLLEKKSGRFMNLDSFERKKKMVNLLMRRGFEFETSVRIVEKFLQKE